MQIFAEFCKVFGSNKVYNGTFPGGERNLWLTQSSLKWKQNPGDDNKHSKCLKVRGKTDGRYTNRYIIKTNGLSLSQMQFVLEHLSELRNIICQMDTAYIDRWKKTAKHLLKTFPKFIQRYFANIVTGAETWVR